MRLSPFSKPAIEPNERWLKNARAAAILGVSTRTIKRWMTNAAMRNALGAVRNGEQWRIQLPKSFSGDSEWAWEMQTDYRLKEIGVHLKDSWERGLEQLGREFARYELETYRLWLAAHSQLSVKSDGVTKDDITEILLLWQTACKILDPLPEGTKVDNLKSKFPEQLRARTFSEDRIRLIMSYWPEQRYFKRVRAAQTLERLEEIRSRMDTSQAVKTCKNLGRKPTGENLRPLLHKNIMEHINDTREELPPNTIKAHKPEDIRRVMEADAMIQSHGGEIRQITEGVDAQGRTFALIQTTNAHGQKVAPAFVDLREPQNGLALRTFRNRHPLKQSPQKEIIETVFDVQDRVPSVDDKPDTGKTPVRGG